MSQAERHPISPASPPSGSPALAQGAIPPRRFVMAFLSTALVGCLSVAGINYVVNPLGYYSPQVVQPLVWRDQIIKLDLMKKGPENKAAPRDSTQERPFHQTPHFDNLANNGIKKLSPMATKAHR